MPYNVLDLRCEFQAIVNGSGKGGTKRLIDALEYYGLAHIDVCEKEEMRQLAMRGPPYTPEERAALLPYCESDVRALLQLLPIMQRDM